MKKLLSIILVVAILGSLVVVLVACNISTKGLQFELIENGTAYEVSLGEASADNIRIPSKHEGLPVTRIARDGFRNGRFSRIKIPNSVTSIDDGAFYSSKITKIVIPKSVTTIGAFAFTDCILLTSVIIPNKVTTIEYATFSRPPNSLGGENTIHHPPSTNNQ